MKKLLALAMIFCLALASSDAEVAEDSSDGALKDTLAWVQAADVTSLDPHVGKETPAVTVSQSDV